MSYYEFSVTVRVPVVIQARDEETARSLVQWDMRGSRLEYDGPGEAYTCVPVSVAVWPVLVAVTVRDPVEFADANTP